MTSGRASSIADDAARAERMTALENQWHMNQFSVVHDDWKYAGPPTPVADPT